MADEPDDPGLVTKLGRRLLVLRVLTIGGAAGAAAPALAAPPRAATPEGAATPAIPVITDNDPSDAAGYGRGRGYYPQPYYRPPPPYRRGVTDNDPYDAAGQGRGGYYRPPPPPPRYYAPPPQPYRGVTDNDPSDPPGRGRGWRRW